MTYSLAITSWNRDTMTIEAFDQVANDPRISEIVIVDDGSKKVYFDKLVQLIADHKYKDKIRLFANAVNRGMMLNKKTAVEHCSNEWVILFDSDNIMDKNYLVSIPNERLHPDVIYCPSFAKPHFDYRKFAGQLVGREEAKKMVNDQMGNACMNTCNYLVHRETYLEVFIHDQEMKGSDTVAFNYLWLLAGKRFFIVPGMEYEHRVHKGSGFMADAEYNMKKAEEYKRKILAL